MKRDKYRALIEEATTALGYRCVRCGTKRDLQFDHIDPATRTHPVNPTIGVRLFWREVRKCQLLCGRCHRIKSAEESP